MLRFRMVHSHLKNNKKKKKKEKKVKYENTNIYMYSAGSDVNGTIAKKRKNFLRETINIVLYYFILSACFVVFFCKYGF